MKITGLDQVPEEPVSHNPAIKKRVLLRSHDLPYLTNFSQAHFAPGQVHGSLETLGHAAGVDWRGQKLWRLIQATPVYPPALPIPLQILARSPLLLGDR